MALLHVARYKRDKRHTSTVLSSARTFRARDPWPAGVRGRRHSHARIHERGASRKFDTVPRRRVAEEEPSSSAGGEEKILTFICSLTSTLAYTYNPGHLLPRHERTWRRLRAFSSVPFPAVCIYTAWWWLLQEFPVDRYLREGIAAVWRGAQAARREGVVVRTRIFCLVHGSSETRRDRGAQPGDARSWRAPRLFRFLLSLQLCTYLREIQSKRIKRFSFLLSSRRYRSSSHFDKITLYHRN